MDGFYALPDVVPPLDRYRGLTAAVKLPTDFRFTFWIPDYWTLFLDCGLDHTCQYRPSSPTVPGFALCLTARTVPALAYQPRSYRHYRLPFCPTPTPVLGLLGSRYQRSARPRRFNLPVR